jgi:hypothetical protein
MVRNNAPKRNALPNLLTGLCILKRAPKAPKRTQNRTRQVWLGRHVVQSAGSAVPSLGRRIGSGAPARWQQLSQN